MTRFYSNLSVIFRKQEYLYRFKIIHLLWVLRKLAVAGPILFQNHLHPPKQRTKPNGKRPPTVQASESNFWRDFLKNPSFVSRFAQQVSQNMYEKEGSLGHVTLQSPTTFSNFAI
jgi:hypothetical protein